MPLRLPAGSLARRIRPLGGLAQAQDPSGVGEGVDARVARVGRNACDQLDGEARREQIRQARAPAREAGVVISPALAEPSALPIDRQHGNENQRQILDAPRREFGLGAAAPSRQSGEPFGAARLERFAQDFLRGGFRGRAGPGGRPRQWGRGPRGRRLGQDEQHASVARQRHGFVKQGFALPLLQFCDQRLEAHLPALGAVDAHKPALRRNGRQNFAGLGGQVRPVAPRQGQAGLADALAQPGFFRRLALLARAWGGLPREGVCGACA